MVNGQKKPRARIEVGTVKRKIKKRPKRATTAIAQKSDEVAAYFIAAKS
jgi:hypothetical protein